jgi:hypothetical protein
MSNDLISRKSGALAKRGMVEVLKPVENARVVSAQCYLQNCCQVDPRYLPVAQKFDAIMPALREIERAKSDLHTALVAPLPKPAAEAAIAQLLAQTGLKAGDGADDLLDGLVAAVDDASDQTARRLDLWETTDIPISPAVLALALQKLRATKTFQLKPSELRAACVNVYRRLREVEKDLDRYIASRQSIDDILLLFGPQSDEFQFKVERRLAQARKDRVEMTWAEALELEAANLPVDHRLVLRLADDVDNPRLAACKARSDTISEEG